MRLSQVRGEAQDGFPQVPPVNCPHEERHGVLGSSSRTLAPGSDCQQAHLSGNH